MIRHTFLAASVALVPTATVAQSANYAESPDLLSCLQERLPISNVEVAVTEESIDVRFDLSNNMNYAIGGVYILLTATYPTRPTKLASWDNQSLPDIPGGLMPGESISTHTSAYIEPRVRQMIEDPKRLTVNIEVESVANGNMVSVRDGFWYSNWDVGPSGDGCP